MVILSLPCSVQYRYGGVMRSLDQRDGYSLCDGEMISHTVFADDVTLPSSTASGATRLLEPFTTKAKEFGLSLNFENCHKFELLKFGK